MDSIKKLSTRAIVGGDVPVPSKTTPLYTVAGIARGFKTGTSNYGDYCELKGDFIATNKETGEALRSTRMYLPEVAEDMILNALSAEGVNAIEFAFEIGVKPNKKSATKYEYYCTSLLEAGENDPLAALVNQVGMNVPGLAAPEPAPEAKEPDAKKAK